MEIAQYGGTCLVWEQGPEPFRAGLTFRAGAIYEGLAERGAAEVISEAVLATVFDSGAVVGVDCSPEVVTFYATGSRTEVAAALVEVSRSLLKLTPARTELGRRRAQAVPTPTVEMPLRWLSRRLFGHTGVGRMLPAGVGAEQVGDAAVDRVARRCFHRANAAITLTGPPPDLAGFTLPEGVRPEHPVVRPTGHPRACVLRGPTSGASLAFEIPHTDAGIALLGLVQDRLEATLRARGLVAPLIDPGVLISRSRLLMTYVADCSPADAAAVARALHAGLASLLREPPSREDLARVRDLYAARADDEGVLDARLDETAARVLDDIGPAAVVGPQGLPVEPAQVLAVAEEALAGAMLVMPDAAGPDAAAHVGLPDRTDWRPPSPPPVTRGEVLRPRRFSRGGDLERLVVGDLGVTAYTSVGPPATVLWTDLAGVERIGTRRRVHAVDGRCVDVECGSLARPEKALAALDERTEPVAWELHGAL